MTEHVPVVIAGGGPVGLWLAAELRLAGVEVVILEREAERSPHSRGAAVHPRTLETLALRGAVQAHLDGGRKIPTAHFALLTSGVDMTVLDTPFPFTLHIPQARTEELLEDRAVTLGAQLRRRHALVGFNQDDDGVGVEVESPDGRYRIHADYLAGCDGAASTVRKATGVEFPGEPSTETYFSADVELDEPPAEGGRFSSHGPQGSMLVAQVTGTHHRVMVLDLSRLDVPRDVPVTMEEMRASSLRLAGTDFGMHSPIWMTRIGNAARQAERYRVGRVFLAGDACHIHPPFGGQGLNCGLQDAMNLGWRLAAQVHGWAPAGLLDQYSAERHAVGERLLEISHAQQALATAATRSQQVLRQVVDGWLSESRELNRVLAERIAVLDIRYEPEDADAHPLVGVRAPNLAFEDGAGDLFGLMHAGRFVLLDLDVALDDGQPVSGSVLERHTVALSEPPSAWDGVRVALIRPDGYIAWVGTASDPTELRRQSDQALAAWTGSPMLSRQQARAR